MDNVFQMSRKSFAVFSTCYLDLEVRSTKYYTNFGLETAKWLKEKFPAVLVKNAYMILISLRAIKEQVEIDKIKASLETTKSGIEALIKNAKPGLYEYELKSHFDYALSSRNKRHSFDLIAASGKNATILHYVRNDNLLKDGELVLFDLGCYTDYYASDISRTIPINGKFSPRQREVYEAVLDVNKKCIEFVKEGITFPELNAYAKDLLAKACIGLGLIKDESEVGKYYYHSVSHSLGLDVHDPAMYTEPIMAGVVLTIEPGLYIAEEGIGVRVEDNVLVTKEGRENLSQSIIKEVKDIESMMN
jgi:Xaa-Pro aminopeptidase